MLKDTPSIPLSKPVEVQDPSGVHHEVSLTDPILTNEEKERLEKEKNSENPEKDPVAEKESKLAEAQVISNIPEGYVLTVVPGPNGVNTFELKNQAGESYQPPEDKNKVKNQADKSKNPPAQTGEGDKNLPPKPGQEVVEMKSREQVIGLAETLIQGIKDDEQKRIEDRYGKTLFGKIGHWMDTTKIGSGVRVASKIGLGVGLVAGGATLGAMTGGGALPFLGPLMYTYGLKNGISGAMQGVQELMNWSEKGTRTVLQQAKKSQLMGAENIIASLRASTENPNNTLTKEQVENIGLQLVAGAKDSEIKIDAMENEQIRVLAKQATHRFWASTAATTAIGLFGGVPIGIQNYDHNHVSHAVNLSYRGAEFLYNANEPISAALNTHTFLGGQVGHWLGSVANWDNIYASALGAIGGGLLPAWRDKPAIGKVETDLDAFVKPETKTVWDELRRLIPPQSGSENKTVNLTQPTKDEVDALHVDPRGFSPAEEAKDLPPVPQVAPPMSEEEEAEAKPRIVTPASPRPDRELYNADQRNEEMRLADQEVRNREKNIWANLYTTRPDSPEKLEEKLNGLLDNVANLRRFLALKPDFTHNDLREALRITVWCYGRQEGQDYEKAYNKRDNKRYITSDELSNNARDTLFTDFLQKADRKLKEELVKKG